jgi:hypothetical protein
MYTLSDLRTAIEHAPNSGGPTNPDLIGWIVGEHTVCNDCSGRIAGRGCGYMLRGAVPIWDGVAECVLQDFHK